MIPIHGGAEVLTFLGWSVEAYLVAQADIHAAQAATLALSYTRRRGFGMDEDSNPTVEQDIAAVIVRSGAVRLQPERRQADRGGQLLRSARIVVRLEPRGTRDP